MSISRDIGKRDKALQLTSIPEALTTLAEFYQDTLEIRYHNSLSTDWSLKWQRIRYHERIHFYQSIGTTLGIQSLVISTDRLYWFFRIISEIFGNKERLSLPILAGLKNSDLWRGFDESIAVWKYRHDTIYCPAASHDLSQIEGKITRQDLEFIETGPFGRHGILIRVPIFRAYTDLGESFTIAFGERMLREAMATLYEYEFDRDVATIKDLFDVLDDLSSIPQLMPYTAPLRFCYDLVPWLSLQTLKYLFFISLFFHPDIIPGGIPLYFDDSDIEIIRSRKQTDISPGETFVKLITSLRKTLPRTVHSPEEVYDQVNQAADLSNLPCFDRIISLSSDYIIDGSKTLKQGFSGSLVGVLCLPLLNECSRLLGLLNDDHFNFINDLSLIILSNQKMMLPIEVHSDQWIWWKNGVPLLNCIVSHLFLDLLHSRRITCIFSLNGECVPGEESVFTPNFCRPSTSEECEMSHLFSCCCPKFLSIVKTIVEIT